eukprot:scaffold122523_cov14-Prasinocladus_malaysianus.AAC.1
MNPWESTTENTLKWQNVRKKERVCGSGQATFRDLFCPSLPGASLILRIDMSGLSRVFRCPVRCLPGETLSANPKGLSPATRSFIVVRPVIEPASPGLKGSALFAELRRARWQNISTLQCLTP